MVTSLEDAKKGGVCRICEEQITVNGGHAVWMDWYEKITYPIAIVLNYGKEFAHKNCLVSMEPKEILNVRALQHLIVKE